MARDVFIVPRSGSIRFRTNEVIDSFISASSGDIIISGSGNTGIGTEKPVQELHVWNNISASIFFASASIDEGLSDFIVWESGSGEFKRRTSGADGTSGTAGSGGTSGADGTSGTAGSGGTSGADGTSGTAGSGGTSGADGTSGTAGSGGSSGTAGSGGTSGSGGSSGSSGSGGTSGADGTSGTAGSGGTSGADGTSGTAGSGGSSGTAGSGGTSGADGTSGTAGSGGTSGADGTSGTAGSGGTSGADGTSGTAGSGGTSGADGTSGTAGSGGSSGTAGSGGTSGADGTSGTAGSGGTSGADGTSGSGGTSGADGTSGTAGSGGTSGADGTSGTAGSGGTSGADGTSGTAGSGGTSGADGTSGTAGSGGASGTSGVSGTSGTAGSGGASGTSGTAGSGGASGTSGTAGSGGTSGIDAASATWTGSDGLNTVFLVTATDNVGIGTTDPKANLHIYDTTDPRIIFDTGGPADWVMGIDDSDGDSFKINIGQTLDTNNVLTFSLEPPTYGFVGIGTTTPSTELQVSGTVSASMFEADNIAVGVVSNENRMAGYTSGVPIRFIGKNNSYTNIGFGSGSCGDGYAATPAPTDGLIVEGNVGIGMTNPSDKLEVVGNIDVTGTYKMDNADIINSSKQQTGDFKTRSYLVFGRGATITTDHYLGGPGCMNDNTYRGEYVIPCDSVLTAVALSVQTAFTFLASGDKVVVHVQRATYPSGSFGDYLNFNTSLEISHDDGDHGSYSKMVTGETSVINAGDRLRIWLNITTVTSVQIVEPNVTLCLLSE